MHSEHGYGSLTCLTDVDGARTGIKNLARLAEVRGFSCRDPVRVLDRHSIFVPVSGVLRYRLAILANVSSAGVNI